MNIDKRLKALEHRFHSAPLLVEAQRANGERVTVTASECIVQGLDFLRISPKNKGANLRELDVILEYILKA